MSERVTLPPLSTVMHATGGGGVAHSPTAGVSHSQSPTAQATATSPVGGGTGMLSPTRTSETKGNMSEGERLDALHFMHTSLLNPSHDHLIIQHLAKIHASGRRSHVLDVGAGTGAWALTVAEQHPYSDLVGIDINWSNYRPLPLSHGNVDFFTLDVRKPLPWTNFFDIVHAKLILMDIPHYPQLIQRLANTLRPGGMLILIESELSYESAIGQPAGIVLSWFKSLKDALASQHTDTEIPRRLDEVVSATGLFAPQFFFQEIGCPLGPYLKGDSQTFSQAGEIHAYTVRATLIRLVCNRVEPSSERSRLLSLVEACVQTLMAPDARYLQRLYAVYAYKRPPTVPWQSL